MSEYKKKYLVKNFWLYIFLKTVDFFSFYRKTQKLDIKKNPKKILISNIAHLGDVVVSTAILSILKKKYPNCEIGFLCSSESKELLENHKLIKKLHFFEHFRLNRQKKAFFLKIFQNFRSKCKARKEIIKEKYDIAIDLRYHFPNSIHLLFKSKVPIRVGFTSSGFTNYLTHPLNWEDKDQYVGAYHLELLKLLDVKPESNKNVKPSLSLININKNCKAIKEGYVVFHIGAGDENKEVALHDWTLILNRINLEGCKALFTGKGESENQKIESIIKNRKNCINLCDKLTILALLEKIKKAKLLITVDSFSLHIASGFNIPTVVLFSEINNFFHWVLKRENLAAITFSKDKKLDIEDVVKKINSFGVLK